MVALETHVAAEADMMQPREEELRVQDCSEFELRRVSWTATIRNWGGCG